MGLTSAFSKGGGGKLNNVDGVIESYEFSTVFPYPSKSGKKPKANPFPSLWLNLSIKVDDAEEAEVAPMFAGDATQWIISDDGQTISPDPDQKREPQMFGSAPRLLQSMFDNDFPEIDYEEGGAIDLSALIDERFRFVQVVDVEATKKQGQVVDKKDPKKFWDRKTLEVSAYYPADAKPAAKSAKTNGAAKGKSKQVEEDYTEEATATLLSVLAANDGEINKAKLGVPLQKALLKSKSANKDAVSALVRSDDFLETEDGWSYNKKSGVIEAV